LKVTPELDRSPESPSIDFNLGVFSDDGFRLYVGGVEHDQSYPSDRGPGESALPVRFAAAGLYPIRVLYAANASGISAGELVWYPQTTGGTRQFVPQDSLYVAVPNADQLITFDDANAGTPPADRYRNRGLVFNTTGGVQITDGRTTDFVPVTPARVLGAPTPSPTVPGAVEFSFVVPGTSRPAVTDSVSFYVINAASAPATYKAYDIAGNVLASGQKAAGLLTQDLVTIRQPRIARVVVTLGGESRRDRQSRLHARVRGASRPDGCRWNRYSHSAAGHIDRPHLRPSQRRLDPGWRDVD
jgi:hypothetical protein